MYRYHPTKTPRRKSLKSSDSKYKDLEIETTRMWGMRTETAKDHPLRNGAHTEKVSVHQIKNSPGTSGPRIGLVLGECRKQLIAQKKFIIIIVIIIIIKLFYWGSHLISLYNLNIALRKKSTKHNHSLGVLRNARTQNLYILMQIRHLLRIIIISKLNISQASILWPCLLNDCFYYLTCLHTEVVITREKKLNWLLSSNALGKMPYSQEHLKTMVYAYFGRQRKCIRGNSKIEHTEN